MILEGASKDRHISTPDEWQGTYLPAIMNQVNQVLSLMKSGGRPAMPLNAASPLLNNPAGVPINLGKRDLRQEDLHIPESRRRRSGVGTGASASPSSISDPATAPQITQTPLSMATPSAYPLSTPATGNKRTSTGSPTGAQMPPTKVQVGATVPAVSRDRTLDEAIAKRQAKEKADELERQEQRKNPLEYVKNAVYKAVAGKKSDQTGAANPPAPVVQGLADKVRRAETGAAANATSAPTTPGAIIRSMGERTSPTQRAQLPSPPWSGTMTPRQLAETFANTTDIQFALDNMYSVKRAPSNGDDLSGFSMNDMLVSSDEQASDEQELEELTDMGFLSPLAGDAGWDEAYAWTKDLQIPWNGDINTIIEQSTNLGVVA
jgi:hypothetical protein